MDCIFCKILEGSASCYKIYEDEHTLAFLDIAKDADGHTVVIPKKHVTNILDCDDDTLQHVMNTVQRISKHYVSACGWDGVNILNANDVCAGQSVFHLHFHIIPRKKNDGLQAWPKFGKCKTDLETMHNLLKM